MAWYDSCGVWSYFIVEAVAGPAVSDSPLHKLFMRSLWVCMYNT